MAPIAHSPTASLPQTPTITKPIKPLLRRQTLSGTVRSRDEAELDLYSDSMSVPSSPSKRARTVTFNPTVQEQFAPSPPALEIDKNLDIIRFDVKRALDDHIKGIKEDGYNTIKEIFSSSTKPGRHEVLEKNQDMKIHLLALSNYVSLLGRSCSELVKAILECNWVGRDEMFVKIYIQKFLGPLVSAQGVWVGSALSMLVEKFIGLRISHGRLPELPIVSREQLLQRVHGALKYLLGLIPSASGTLVPIVNANFPLSDDTKRTHMVYIENLLRLVDYAPELRSEVFALITDRLVKIDVQMQVDLDDLDDEVAAAIVQASSNQSLRSKDDDMEENEDDSDADSTTSDESIDDEEARIKMVQSNVEKMDAILDTLFAIYKPYFNQPHSSDAKAMFDTLLVHFRNIILPTYRSRHTQFLLFHFSQTSEDLIDAFTGECITLAFNSGESAVVKQSAAAYLASFVSRGARVPSHVVLDIFQCIGQNLDATREKYEMKCRGPDLQRYSLFYALTQALLYIFCFRWRDLIVSQSAPSEDGDFDDEDFLGRDHQWHPGVRELLHDTIYSKLNPLRICAPAIVEEFARTAHHLRFLYVYPLLEQNKRVRLSQYTLAVGDGSVGALRDSGFSLARNRAGIESESEDSWHQLDAYFPFDPYQLPVSRKWVEGDYVTWKGIPGLNQEDDDSETSEEDDEDADDDHIEEDTATDNDDDEML